MKRKSILRTAGAAVLSALMLLTAVPVMAAGSNYEGFDSESKNTTTFDKYLVMDQEANVPNAAFTYQIEAGEAQTYDVEGKKFEVLAGVDAGEVTITDEDEQTEGYQLVFQTTDTSYTTLQAGDDVKDFKGAQRYAKKTATLDFSKVGFTEPGIYRYIITESGENQGVTNDEDLTRALDVYVEDASDDTAKKLAITSYVLHSTEDTTIIVGDDNKTTYSDNKEQGFTNTYDTSNLTFRKEVSGNQASHDKYFKFTVTISEAVPGTIYTVNLDNADKEVASNAATLSEYVGQKNPDKLTVGDDGTITQVFYLQHGQEITIQGLAKDTVYNVTENKEDYVSTEAGVKGYEDPVNGTIISTDLKTSYLNTRDGIIPTGVMMTVAPFAALTLAGGIGAASVVFKKRKKEDSEA